MQQHKEEVHMNKPNPGKAGNMQEQRDSDVASLLGPQLRRAAQTPKGEIKKIWMCSINETRHLFE